MKNKALFFFGFILLILLGCSKKNEETIIDTPKDTKIILHLSNDKAKSLEVIKITSENYKFSEEEYNMVFGDDLILKFTKQNDTLISFAPIVEDGIYNIQLDAGNGYYGETYIQIENEKINNIKETFENETVEVFENLSVSIGEFTENISKEDPLYSYKEYIDSFIVDAASLTENQQLELIYFFRGNQKLLNSISEMYLESSFIMNKTNAIADRNIKRIVAKAMILTAFSNSVTTILTGSGIAVGVLYSQPLIGAALVIAGLAYASLRIIKGWEAFMTEVMPSSTSIEGFSGNKGINYKINKNTNAITVKNKETIQFQLTTNYAKFSNEHREGYQGYEGLFALYDEISLNYNKAAHVVNSFSNGAVSWFADWMTSTPKIKQVPAKWTELSDNMIISETENAVANNYTLVGFPSDVSMDYSISTSGILDISFDINDVNEMPRTITGNLVYDDGTIKFAKELSFIVENYVSLEIISGNNQKGFVSKVLDEPVIIKATNFEGEAYSGVTINYTTTQGENEFSTQQITTNSDGLATINWKLNNKGFHLAEASAILNNEVVSKVEFYANSKDLILTKISGDNQTTHNGGRLKNDMVVELKDDSNEPIEGVAVYFNARNQSGDMDTRKVITDSNGRAANNMFVERTYEGDFTIAVTAAGEDDEVIDEVYFHHTANVYKIELTGVWHLRFYQDDTRNHNEQTQISEIDFQNIREKVNISEDYSDYVGLIIKRYNNGGWNIVEDPYKYNDFWKQRYIASGDYVSLTNTYWTNIEFRFRLENGNPNRLVGYSVGLSYNGQNMELIKQ